MLDYNHPAQNVVESNRMVMRARKPASAFVATRGYNCNGQLCSRQCEVIDDWVHLWVETHRRNRKETKM